MDESAKLNHLTNLRQILTTRFNDGELRSLCFDLGVDYESLPGEGKADKARELVAYCERHERIPELIRNLIQLRPDLEITELGDDFFAFLKFIKKRDSNLQQEFIEARNRHWDNFQRTVDSLDEDARFEVQKLNSLNYLEQFGLTVKELKGELFRLGYYKGEVDNNFSVDLVKALMEFQRMNNMRHVDGVFGPLTYQMMAEKLKEMLSKTGKY